MLSFWKVLHKIERIYIKSTIYIVDNLNLESNNSNNFAAWFLSL